MKKNAFRNLCDDILAHGLLVPIVLFEGMILDGWHRYLACLEKDVTPRFVDFEGDTTAALEYVKSTNLNRRHSTPGQIAMTAAQFATLQHGGDRRSEQQRNSALESKTIKQVAAEFSVSEDRIKSARIVWTSGDADLIEKVRNNELALSAAVKEIRAKNPKPPRKGTPTPTLTPKTPEPSSERKPESHLDEHGSEERVSGPPLVEGAAEGPAPAPDPAGNTVKPAGDLNRDGRVDNRRSTDEKGNGPANAERAPDPPTPIVEEPAVEQGGLFRPEEVPVSPPRKVGKHKATPQNQGTNKKPASSNRGPDEQSAAPSRATEEQAAAGNIAARAWFESNRRVTIFFQSSIEVEPLNPTLAEDIPELTPEDWEEVWRSFLQVQAVLNPYVSHIEISFIPRE